MYMKKAIAGVLVLILLLACATSGGAVSNTDNSQKQSESSGTREYVVGASFGEMIGGGGRIVTTNEGTYYLDGNNLIFDGRALAEGELSCLNVIGGCVYYINSGESGRKIMCRSLADTTESEILNLGDLPVREMYVVNGKDYYLLANGSVILYSSEENSQSVLRQADDLLSFFPCEYGIVYARGSLFHIDLYAEDKLIVSDAEDYYVDEALNGGSIVFTKQGCTFQVSLYSSFLGNCIVTDFTGYGIVDTEELLADIEQPSTETEQPKRSTVQGSRKNRSSYRKTLSQGVQNIVKRAYQMTDIQWTPQKNISGWNSEMTYYAGTTYTGLPYGQPVYASYVPWSTTLSGFISAVNDPNSKMYTSKSTYGCVAPYYSCDCSAFVSWAWNLSSRQTTSSIPNFATLVSSTTYTGLQVGDCFCKKGTHVVLVTDITYDNSGAINGVEISESTVNSATNYCCQKTWYGTGYSYPLSKLQTKYIDSGYGLYRSNTRDSVTYTHTCAVPLEGDSCNLCGKSGLSVTSTYATVQFPSDTPIYCTADETSEVCGTVYAGGEQRIVASATVDDVIWYELEVSGWVKADQAAFGEYLKTVSITNEYMPSGNLPLGKVFPLEGNITSIHPMVNITAMIVTAAGAQEQIKTVSLNGVTFYNLKSSAIDNAMVFNDLPAGDYMLVLQIAETASCDGRASEQLETRLEYPFSVRGTSGEQSVTYHGIDVSKYQGDIDWDTVADQIDFAIIRCGYGDDLTDQDDTKWFRNVEACTRLGIPFGVYIYSYALTDAQALSEAQHVIRLLDGYSPTLPVYLDLEDSGTTGTLSSADILRHTKIFCEAIGAAGYTPGVYASYSWWTAKLSSGEYDRWSRWIARYADNLNYSGSYDAWQYSDSGTISGISGSVDLNYWYGEFPNAEPEHTHSYTASATEATCTASGSITYTCAVCGDCYSETIAPLGHSYGEWTVSTKATCTEIGEEISVCERCGDTQRRTIPATGHSYQNGICTVCGKADPSVQKGDINGDGAITSADAVLLARYLVNLTTFSQTQIYAADLNGDGFVTSADAVLMAKLLVE